MTHVLRHKKILLIVALNLIVALLITFIAESLFHKSLFNLTNIVNQESIPIENYKPYLFSIFKVFSINLILLLLLSYLVIKTTRPILQELLLNEKDLITAQSNTKKKEKELFTLLKNLPVGLVLYDEKAQMTNFNDYAIAYLGIPGNQFKGKGVVSPQLQLASEDGSELPFAEYPVNKVITTRSILKNKVAAIAQPSGNLVWVIYNAFPVFNFFGNLKEVIVTFFDITERKQMEIALKEANNKLREQSEELTQLLDNLNEINTKLAESEARYKLISDFSTSWETYRHPDGTLVYCSPAVEEVIGYTQEEYLKGISFSTFVHPDDLEIFFKNFNTGIAGKFVPSFVVRLIHKNKTIIWVDSALRPVISENGELLGTRFSIRDITMLKETELALQENRELLNLVFQYSNDWESYRDKDGKLIYCSLACEQLLGYQVSEYLSNKIGFKDIFHPDDFETAMAHFKRALSGETIPSLTLRYIHRNKSVVWVDASARPVFSDSGEMLGLRFSAKDITKLKENEFELKELNATKDKFFSIISHDLRSPFSALIGYSELLFNEYNSISEETIKDYISKIYSTSKNTFELLENLLAWSYSQTGKIKLNPTKINLKSYSDSVIQMFNPIAQNKKIKLINTITEDIYGCADENMLHTIFRNLISNAIKYSYESGTIKLSANAQNSIVVISVSDTGMGMSEEIKNSLFKISGTKSQPGTHSEKGTGLGLILCKEFTEKHGGKIWVESEEGIGSSFSLTIPCI